MDNMRLRENCTENKTGIEFVCGKNLKYVLKKKKGLSSFLIVRD